jgi:hypothetical protein
VQTTLGDRLRSRDERRFVGRATEIGRFDELLARRDVPSVVLIHGPGGMGKSTLLREIARRADASGRPVWLVDARELAPAPGELEQALSGATDAENPVVLFDTWERMSAAGAHLRRVLLPMLPDTTLVVIAGREAPEADWFQGGWEQVVEELPIAPLTRADAEALVREHGVSADERVSEIVAWGQGAPLALALAADAARIDPAWRTEGVEERPELVRALVRRVTETELDGGNREVAAVAALARTTTRAMLREVLPEVDPAEAEQWLRRLTFSEAMGPGVTLHDLARRALRADLRNRAPDRERELRRRIADHLYARAVAGNPWLMLDLAELIDDQALRWGFGAEGSVEYRLDGPREGDIEIIDPQMVERENSAWWLGAREFFLHAPERVIVVRDRTAAPAGFCIAVTPDNAPQTAERDSVLGAWLAHARKRAPEGDAILWRDSVDLTADTTGDISSPVLALLNTAAMLRSGLANPRYLYLPIDPGNEAAVAFSQGIGAKHVPRLDADVNGKVQECHIFDAGPGGTLAGVRGAIYAELGLPVPEPGEASPAPVAGAGPVLDADTVKEVLRNVHRPLELAASPLATGTSPEDRAESVRRLLRDAVAGAFGHTADEELLRKIVERGYLDADTSHERVADELYLSRATYFRRLRQASGRIAAYVLARQVD